MVFAVHGEPGHALWWTWNCPFRFWGDTVNLPGKSARSLGGNQALDNSADTTGCHDLHMLSCVCLVSVAYMETRKNQKNIHCDWMPHKRLAWIQVVMTGSDSVGVLATGCLRAGILGALSSRQLFMDGFAESSCGEFCVG